MSPAHLPSEPLVPPRGQQPVVRHQHGLAAQPDVIRHGSSASHCQQRRAQLLGRRHGLQGGGVRGRYSAIRLLTAKANMAHTLRLYLHSGDPGFLHRALSLAKRSSRRQSGPCGAASPAGQCQGRLLLPGCQVIQLTQRRAEGQEEAGREAVGHRVAPLHHR